MMVKRVATTLVGAVAVCGACHAGSFASKLLNAADKTIQTVKNNPKYMQKLDEVTDVVVQSSKELYDTVSLVMSEEDKAAINQVTHTSFKTLQSAAEQEFNSFNSNIGTILGEEKMKVIDEAAQEAVSVVVEVVNTQENKDLCQQLKQDLKPVMNDLEDITQEFQTSVE